MWPHGMKLRPWSKRSSTVAWVGSSVGEAIGFLWHTGARGWGPLESLAEHKSGLVKIESGTLVLNTASGVGSSVCFPFLNSHLVFTC